MIRCCNEIETYEPLTLPTYIYIYTNIHIYIYILSVTITLHTVWITRKHIYITTYNTTACLAYLDQLPAQLPMRAGEGVDENSSDGLGEHARKTRSFSLRPLRRKKKKTKRKRERFFDLEFFEKRFSDPRETAFIFDVFPRTHLAIRVMISFGDSLRTDRKRRATPKLSSFRFFDLTSIFSHRSIPLLLFISSSFSFLFRFVLSPPPITRAVVNPFAQSNRK